MNDVRAYTHPGPPGRGIRWLALALCLVAGISTAAERDPNDARAMLELITGDMMTALRDPHARGTTADLRALVERHLLPHIDFEVSSTLVLGEHWQRASAVEREAFVSEFRSFLTRFYTQALSGYLKARDVPGDIIAFDNELRLNGDRQVLVSSRVRQPGGSEFPVAYELLWVDSWKVIDVKLGGISVVKNYHVSFSSTVANAGIGVLIAQLRSRNDTFYQSL
tara:strand:+ start:337 stop:1005 length:669 start_codon:yes stop_codon:yes gene_type:complete